MVIVCGELSPNQGTCLRVKAFCLLNLMSREIFYIPVNSARRQRDKRDKYKWFYRKLIIFHAGYFAYIYAPILTHESIYVCLFCLFCLFVSVGIYSYIKHYVMSFFSETLRRQISNMETNLSRAVLNVSKKNKYEAWIEVEY